MSTALAPTLNAPHPIHLLAVATLGRKETLLRDAVEVHPAIDVEAVRDALTVLGRGLDHGSGEQVMAFAELSIAPGSDPLATFLLVTDRRILGTLNRSSGQVADARFGEITARAERRRLLGATRRVHAGDAWHDLSFPDVRAELGRFLDGVLAWAPGDREPLGRPLCAPSVSDPTGASLARIWMPVPDPRASQLLVYVREASRRGRFPVAVARDLVARIALAYRNRAFGRGGAAGRATSPLAANDLAATLVDLLGAPRRDQGGAVRTLELPTGMRRGLGRAALGTAIGLGVGALTGFGWTTAPRHAIGWLTARMTDMGSFSGFRLEATGHHRALAREVPGYACALERALLDAEEAMLARRCVAGWRVRPEALLAWDDGAVASALEELVPPGGVTRRAS